MIRVHCANTENADMYYLVRSRIPDLFFFIEVEHAKIAILSVLEIDAFKEHQNQSVEAVPLEPLWERAKKIEGGESGLCKLAFVIFQEYGLMEKDVAVARSFPLDVADYVRSKGAKLLVTHPFLPERAKKSAQEISFIRKNVDATKAAFAYIEEVLRSSGVKSGIIEYRDQVLTSELLKRGVESVMFKHDMDDVEGMIISSGGHSAMPHHKGGGAVRPNTPIVCDLFFRNRNNRYFADMTRTYVKGTPTKKLARMYDGVMRAQDAAFAKIRPGAAAKEVYDASVAAIRDAGFDVGEKGFIHGLGHGLGLELHESPNAGPNSKDMLEVGHVLTVEPGLYYPDEGGVRIEDVVVVTENGFENLTNFPRILVIP